MREARWNSAKNKEDKTMNRKGKMSYKLVALIVTILAIVMGSFYFITESQLTNIIRSNVINSMQTVAMREATIVEKYMGEAEAYLLAYSRAGEVTNLLKILRMKKHKNLHRPIPKITVKTE